MNGKLKYGLENDVIESIISTLCQNQKITKVILFGSRAKDTFHAGSDVDLALIGLGINLDDILNVMIEIEKLNLPYKFDLIIYERIKESELIEHINRVGIVLFDRKKNIEN